VTALRAAGQDFRQMPGRPIFIVGTMRSGTTLLRLILDAHPRLAIPEETGFMAAVSATRNIRDWQHGDGWFKRLGWTDEEFDARLREFYAGLFERHALRQGKQRWGDKTPMHAHHIPQMSRLFPDAVFVGIVRHPGAVVHSLMRKFHYGLADAVTYWDSTNKEILRSGLEFDDDRFALLRYEDLVADPGETLRELVDWLGEPWSEDLLRHNDVHAARGAPRLSAGATRTRDPIRGELADRWSEELPDRQQEVLVNRTGALARFLGYDPSRPGAQTPLVPPPSDRSRLLSGGTLARRERELRSVGLDAPADAVIVPEMNAVELAKRMQELEAELTRMSSLRAVRLSVALRRAERRLTGIPAEWIGLVRKAMRRRG
jgi:Sulfotransferase family